jgi:hypothetical protein
MFGCGSGSVTAACRLYQNVVPGQWIPFSNTDKQQDNEDKGQCWHQVWKLESWMILLNILGPADGGLQLLNTLPILPFNDQLGSRSCRWIKFFESVFWGFCSGITEDSILLVFDILTLCSQILKLQIGPPDCLKMRMLHCLKTLGSNYPFLDHHSFIHSFSSLSYDRSKASSKASSPNSAIQSFLFQMRVFSPFLKVIQ